jgi:hypothetical protein
MYGHCVGAFQGLCAYPHVSACIKGLVSMYLHVSACSMYLRSSCIQGRTCFCMRKLLSRAGHVFAYVGAFHLDTDVFALIFTY